jgi:hypothetical protein
MVVCFNIAHAAVLLSVEDAAHLAREIANASRRYAEKAEV